MLEPLGYLFEFFQDATAAAPPMMYRACMFASIGLPV